VNDTLEHNARRIAERGREALVARLRPAFEEAAAAHADVLELEPEQLDAMVQRAADKADGLQWRRALASVATEELGIGLGEALGHPAVARAQAIVGAPTYEDSLAALSEAGQLDNLEGLQEGLELQPEEPSATEESPPDEDIETEQPDTILLAAVHLGGIANLSPGEGDVELRMSEDGLDIVRGGSEILGRLAWHEVRSLDVPPPRGRRRRRQGSSAQLVIHTVHGDASFDVQAMSSEELQGRVALVTERWRGG
jgi:hypothetical protein